MPDQEGPAGEVDKAAEVFDVKFPVRIPSYFTSDAQKWIR
jgi:hypothetical protein